jgi:hypothetical protein
MIKIFVSVQFFILTGKACPAFALRSPCLIVRICLLYSVYMFTYSVYMFIKTGEVNSLTWPKNGHNGPTRHAEPLAW